MKRSVAVTLGAVGVVVIAGAAGAPFALQHCAKSTADTLLDQARASGATTARYGSLETNIWKAEVTIKDLVVEIGGDAPSSLNIQEAKLNMPWAMGGTIHASHLSAQNVAIGLGDIMHKVPQMDIDGFVLRGPEKSADHPTVALLRRLDAGQVKLSAFSTTQTNLEVERTVTGFAIDDVKAGRAASISFDSATNSMKLPENNNKPISIKAGAGSYKNVDFAGLTGLYLQTGNENQPRTPMLDSATVKDLIVEGIEAKAEETGESFSSFKIGSLELTNFQARPLVVPPSQFSALQARMATETDVKPEDTKLMTRAMADILRAMSIESFKLHNLTMEDKDNGKFEIAEMAIDKMGDQKIGGFTISGVSFDKKGDGGKIGTIALRGLDMGPTIAFTLDVNDDQKIETIGGYSRAMPVFQDFKIENVDINALTERVKVDQFLIETGDHVEGVPLRGALKVSGARVALKDDEEFGELVRPLKDMGYKEITADYGMAYHVDDAKKELRIDDISFGGKDMAELHTSTFFAPVDKSLITMKAEEAITKLADVEVRPISLVLKDKGITNKVIAYLAKQSEVSEEEFRAVIDGTIDQMAEELMPEALSKESIAAVKKFIQKPDTLTVTFTPKEATKAFELYMMQQILPESMLGVFKVDVKAGG